MAVRKVRLKKQAEMLRKRPSLWALGKFWLIIQFGALACACGTAYLHLNQLDPNLIKVKSPIALNGSLGSHSSQLTQLKM